MSNEPTSEIPDQLRCPACRAKQAPQAACRRCGADLEFLLRALRRVRYLRQRLQHARAEGDHDVAQATLAELKQLAPSELKSTRQ